MSCFRPASVLKNLCFGLAIVLLCANVLAQMPSGDVVITSSTVWPSGTYALNSLAVENGAVLTIGGGSTVLVTGAALVTQNSNVVLQSINTTAQVNGVWAGTGVTIHAGSFEVDAGSTINADGQGYAVHAGPGAGTGSYINNGGSYGGVGGGQASTTTYGSATVPVDLGSGGDQYNGTGGAGGGAIQLLVSGTLTNNGVISANGAGAANDAGAGAGGSIYVMANTLAGAGVFTANGGANSTPSSGNGGGGGRVAVYYASVGTPSVLSASTATGGSGDGNPSGSVGTVAFFDTSGTNEKMYVYQNFSLPANSNLTYNQITVQNGAVLTIGGGSTVTVSGAVLVTANSSIVLQSINTTAQVNGVWAGTGVTIHAGSFEVDAGSTINADGQGYAVHAGPGAGTGSYINNGGSYGGAGGGQASTTTYGSATAPVDLGSGGDQYSGTGGAGGGAIQLLVSGMLTNNGVISANGAGASNDAGGGAGGSIYVTANMLAGAGTFTANGGANSTPSSGNGGGGGRMAVYYASAASFTGFTASTVTGGTGNGNPSGALGTAAFFDTSAANNNVSVYQNFAIPANATVQYNGLTVAGGASMTIGGGTQLAVTQALRVTGNMVLQSINTTAEINGSWQGKGVTILAGSLQVDASGALNADGQGYAVQAGPGAGANGYRNNGGSYGGAGGGMASTTTYGSATAPVNLGSGGDQYNGTGGSGGGAIQLLVSGMLTNNGVISANGTGASNIAGGGAGGSIYIAANTLAGTGTFMASGGANLTPSGNGGGGGRIAVDYVTDTGFNQSALAASGGAGAVAGAVGTVKYVNTPTGVWVQPTASVIHDATTLQWFTDAGATTTVTASGPETFTVATGAGDFSSATWDTTQVPDGAYQLLLKVLDAAGNVLQEVPKAVVINNSVLWYSGTLTANTHWTAANVYALDGNLIIPAGITLTIDPGTVVKALPGTEIIVQSGGTLSALGDASNPVIFTTFDDSSVGGNTDFNQGISVPSPGDWSGIVVLGGGTYDSNGKTELRYAQTLLFGTISANMTLTSTQNYEVSGNLIVASGVTLTIQPGTVVKFDIGGGIDVQAGATLLANGTLAQPIYFTSINDSSIGGRTGSTGAAAAPGDWNSILIDAATASFQHVQMQYGGGPVGSSNQAGMVETDGTATVTIASSTLLSSYAIGIQTGYPNGGGDTVTVTDSTFYGNEDRAINAYPGSTVHVVNDTFDGNAYGPFAHGGVMDVENSVISNSVGTQFGSVEVCCGSTLAAFTNNDVYTTAAGVSNYVGLTDPTGTQGNISANPVYLNQALHDYRPTYGSPLIDAANGTVPNYPLTDSFGLARYNDPLVTTKTGTPDVNGNYPDMGAFEFVQTAPSNLDLTVSNVQGPSSAIVGSQVTVNWIVTNIGSGTAYGPWHDAVYLVSDPNTNPVQAYGGIFLEGAGIVLGPGASYNATATVTVPGTTVGSQRWEVKTNVLGEIFEGANTANNTGIAIDPVNIDLNQLVPAATPLNGLFSSAGQMSYYKVIPSPTQATSVNLALFGVTGSVQLFVGAGFVPTPQQFTYQQVEFDSASASVVIPAGSSQIYYVAAYAQTLASTPAPYTIQASTVSFGLTSISPAAVNNGYSQTITFIGGGFTSNTVFTLVSPSGIVYTPSSTFIADTDHADVTFNLAGVPAGSYSATASNGAVATLTNALTIGNPPTISLSSGLTPGVNLWLDVPEAFRAGFPGQVTLYYENGSGEDIPAPVIELQATGATLSKQVPQCAGCNPNFNLMYQNTETSGLVLGINNQGPAGVLPNGATGSINFTVNDVTGSSVAFSVEALTAFNADPLIGYKIVTTPCVMGVNGELCSSWIPDGIFANTSQLCAAYTPPLYNSVAFTRTCMQLLVKAQFWRNACFNSAEPCSGVDGNSVNDLLAADATQLSTMGIYENDATRLLSFEYSADGFDVFNTRYHQGVFGYGPGRDLDIYAQTTGLTPAPVIFYPDGTPRTFPTVNPNQSNQYLGVPGDYGVLTVGTDASVTLTEKNGTLYHFNAPVGSSAILQLGYIQDTNQNQVTLTYNGSAQLASAVDSFGNMISYVYDSLGHVTQITDPVGRVTTYTYDILSDTLHSTFMTSITDPTGTTSFLWNEGGAHGVGYIADSCITTYCEAAIGINAITFPDGTHTYYTYDAQGRVATKSQDGGAQKVTYTYGATGTVTFTDALGNATQSVPNQYGTPAQTIDPLSHITQYAYDAEEKNTSVLAPLGTTTSIGYDSMGNVSQIIEPLGDQLSFSSNAYGSLQSFTDANGNSTSFTFDAHNNATAVAGPNGIGQKATYDTHGNATSLTNARGNTIQFAYNSNNLLTSKTFSNGTQVTFTYDAHYNPLTVTAANGTTTYSYDSADRVTGVAYPNGQYIHYAYNAGGQRVSLTDSTGFAVQYAYDAAGRLLTVTSGSNTPVVTYTYDTAGNVLKKTRGNGTYTTITYDAASNPLHLINYTSSGGVMSEYDYTYDAMNRQSNITTPSGPWAIGYDANGQITSAGTATTPYSYAYDPAENRVSALSSSYNVNNLNEYTTVGSNTYTYDADGNLTSGGGYTYTYDDLNRLTGMTSPTDTWTYQYDGLNQRVSATHNGTVTQYLIDPSSLASGLGNVEAELNGSGQTVAHYTYGLDLISSVPASGTPSYYHFDASGNTVQMTSASGAVVNNYVYLPFGEKLSSTVGVANPFTYVGEYGVMDEGSGLYYMRNRWYSPALGRFVQRDPIGLLGGTNLYAYTQNDPANFTDPSGLEPPTITELQEEQNRENYEAVWGKEALEKKDEAMQRGKEGIAEIGAGAMLGGVEIVEGGGVITSELINHSIKVPIESAIVHTLVPEAHVSTGFLHPTLGFVLKDMAHYFSFGLLFNEPPPPVETTPVDKPKDPNGKLTSGYGANGYVPADAAITYTVYFENQPTATAPAVIVTVTDPLANNLDWSTVQFNNISFNNVSLNVPTGVTTYSTQAKVSTDSNPVNVTAGLNPATGVLSVTMQSVNPVTGSIPASPTAGFLPPNNSANAGSGSVTFTVKPKTGLANGTAITNQASIVFDVNAAIATNTVTNTLDSSSLTSAITPLPATTTSTNISVAWSGSDPSGSGIASYNIYVSTNGGAYALWLSATTLTSSTYTGIPGQTYSFSSLATNNVGTVQATPGTPQTIAVVFITPNVTVTPASSSITPTQSLPVAIAVASPVTGGSVPTGTVVLSSGTYTSATATLSSGAASITISAGALPTGIDTLTATYTPDSASSATYAAAAGVVQVTVGTVANVPLASLSPSGLTFTAVSGTSSAAQTVQLTNTGTAALTITGVTLAGTGAGSFADTSACGTSLPAGFSCNISVTFTPSLVAGFSATLSVADNAAGTPQSITLTGTGTAVPAPVVSLAPSSLTFTSASGTTSAAQTVTLSNTGNAALSITAITLGGSGATSFAQTNTCGASLAAGSSCPISVVFTPGSVGSFSATLSIADNASGAPQTVGLTGTGGAPLAPIATITPAALTFTAIAGTPSAAQTANLSNTGTAALAISGITLTGSGAASFSQTNTCGTSLAAGSNCLISITFTPSAAAAYNASLSIADNASGSPQTVSLTGTGTPVPAPIASVTPATLNFTSISGITSAVQTSQLSNTGNAPLAITGITFTGTGATSFTQTNTCGTALAAGSNCTISVTFTPTSIASFSASISIDDNASGSPQTVALTGTGTAPPTFQLSATPASQSANAGGTVTYTINFTPQGGAFTNAIALSASGLPSGATATFTPASVTPGSANVSSTLTIQTVASMAAVRTLDGSRPLLALVGLLFVVTRKRRRLALLSVLLLASLAGIASLTGCGSTPKTATYTVTVSGTSGTQIQTTTVTLILHD
jgi:RHS repeat-associated protein